MKLLTLSLIASSCFAAGPSGPVPGFVLDSRTATLRAVTGIPGALRLADAVALPFGVLSAGFAADGDSALAITDGQPGHLVAIRSLASVAVVNDLGAVAEGTVVLALNAKGTAGIVYGAPALELRFVTRLPQTPTVSDPVSTAVLAGAITAAVLDEAGACAVLGTGSVETLCSDGSSVRVLQQTNLFVGAISFANKEKDLWLADQNAKQVLQVVQYTQQPNAAVAATAGDGITKPVGLQITAAGQVLVADAGAQALFAIDPAGAHAIQRTDLNIAPAQLQPLADRSLLLLNDLSMLPFTLYDTSAMRTYFIPAN